MPIIHVLDKQTDQIIGILNSDKKEFYNATRQNSIQNENYLDFTALKKFDILEKRNRLLLSDTDGFFHEYIINYAEQNKRNEKLIKSDASFIDLKKAKVIEPQTLQGATSSTAVSFALLGTEWFPGRIDYTSINTITIDKYTDPYSLLQTIASTFGLEINYRVAIKGNRIIGRYVDMVKQIGDFEGKEIVFGKDLQSVRRIEDNSKIVTALFGVGPESSDGTQLTAFVENTDALQRWGRNGQHLIEIYTPDSTSQDMTLDELRTLTQTELKKRIDSIVTYECTAASLEHIFGRSHEKIRKGQTVRIKDDGYLPPLYLEARIDDIVIDPITNRILSFKLGNFTEFSKSELQLQIKWLTDLIAQKVSKAYVLNYAEKKKIRSDSAPTDTNVIWVKPDPGKNVDIAYVYDSDKGEWAPITTTSASDIVEGEMLFDRLQGGSLKLGDPNVNGDLQIWADTNGDGQTDIVGRIDFNGAFLPYLRSDKIEGNIVNKYKNYAIETYYFDCDNGIDSNDGLTTSTPKANMQAFINRLPKDLNGSTITLRGKGQFIGNIIVDGFRNGILVIADWDGTNIYGLNGFWASDNDCVLVLQNTNIWGPGGNGNAIVNIHHCKFFKADTVSLFGGPSQSHGFYIETTKFFITGCQVYDLTDRGLYAYGVSHGYIVNNKGSAPFAIIADEGSVVTGAGSRWDGSLVRWSNALLGTVDSNNTGWIIDPWYIDTGGSASAPPTQSATQTLTLQPSTGDNYSSSGYWENDSVKQGSWGYGDRYGVWYFDLSAVKGKTIDSATITLIRSSGGTNAARTIYFRTHNYTSRSGRPGGAPAMSAVGATGSIAVGQTASFDIKAMLQNNIASGSDKSIGIYTTGSTDYMSVNTQPTLTITYH